MLDAGLVAIEDGDGGEAVGLLVLEAEGELLFVAGAGLIVTEGVAVIVTSSEGVLVFAGVAFIKSTDDLLDKLSVDNTLGTNPNAFGFKRDSPIKRRNRSYM